MKFKIKQVEEQQEELVELELKKDRDGDPALYANGIKFLFINDSGQVCMWSQDDVVNINKLIKMGFHLNDENTVFCRQ